jgi:hypothetical protein
MHIPGFTASTSLYRSNNSYRLADDVSRSSTQEKVTPQQSLTCGPNPNAPLPTRPGHWEAQGWRNPAFMCQVSAQAIMGNNPGRYEACHCAPHPPDPTNWAFLWLWRLD